MRESMGFTSGMVYGMAQQSRSGRKFKQMDWAKLKRLIEEYKADGLERVEVGLLTDWECTSGVVWRDGDYVKKEDTYTYTSSHWATPAAIFSYEDGREVEVAIFTEGNDPNGYFDFADTGAREDGAADA